MARGKRAAKSGGCPRAKWSRRGQWIRRRVLAWFAGGWRNHQPKRAEKPHSKSSDRKALDGPATRPMTPLAVENSVGKPAAPVAPNAGMGKRDWRTPIPHFVPVGPQGPAGTIVFGPCPKRPRLFSRVPFVLFVPSALLRAAPLAVSFCTVPEGRRTARPHQRAGRKVRTPKGAMPRNSDFVARYTRAARREACRRTVPQKIKPPAVRLTGSGQG